MGRRIPRKPGQPAKSKKHSDLYTDEDPKGTIHGLGFKTPEKAKESVSKIKGSSRSHNHKTQAAISMEQRAKVMGKSKAASVYRKFIDSQKEKTKDMKEENLNEAIPLALPLAAPAASKLLGGAMVGAGAAGLMRNVFKSDASNRSKAMRRGSKITPAQAQARQAKEDRKAAARERAASGQTTPKPTQTTPKVGNKGKNRVDPALERSANEVLRRIRSESYHPLDEILYDPLQELYDLYESEMNVMDKPDLMANSAPNNESPNKGNYRHPVTMKRQEIDALVAQGMNPISAHQSVHGKVDSGEITSKGKLAGTLGRIADNGVRSGVIVEPEKGSILAKDAEIEKELDQVTANDLASPMNQQVPDRDQTAADQYTVSEELEITEEYDYNLDVAYLQKFGRA